MVFVKIYNTKPGFNRPDWLFLAVNEFTKKLPIIRYKGLTKLGTKESGYLPIFRVFFSVLK